MMKYYLVFILIIATQAGFTQPSKFSASVDRNKILIGEPFELSLKAFVAGNSISWPVVDSIPHFEILTKQKLDSQVNNGTLILNQVITLTSWDSGRWAIPSFSIDGSVPSPPILMSVAYAPFDTAQEYHDVKDIMDAAPVARPQWHWYLIGALLLAVLFLLLFPRPKGKKEPGFIPDPGIYKQSLAELDALQKGMPEDAGVLYTKLIGIFRTYLWKRKGLYSHAKTTDDLAAQLQQFPLSAAVQAALLQTLSLSDLAKFAKVVPGKPERLHSIETVRQSIIAIENLK
jgi:hypothetical protein